MYIYLCNTMGSRTAAYASRPICQLAAIYKYYIMFYTFEGIGRVQNSRYLI